MREQRYLFVVRNHVRGRRWRPFLHMRVFVCLSLCVCLSECVFVCDFICVRDCLRQYLRLLF